jgi:hypothetical protein
MPNPVFFDGVVALLCVERYKFEVVGMENVLVTQPQLNLKWKQLS